MCDGRGHGEDRAVHQHTCEVCASLFECVGIDCPDDGWLCGEHEHYEECDGCGLWFPMVDLDGCLCEPCNAALMPKDAFDAAADDADHANKDEKESE